MKHPAQSAGTSAVGFVVIALLLPLAPRLAHAMPDCSAEYLVDETLTSGARWRMCFEHRQREGIILWDVHYTPASGGAEVQVLEQANVAQIHVPYDDNGARYHDVSDYGLGGGRMNDLAPADCPGGTLLRHDGKDVLCKQVRRRGLAHVDDFASVAGEQLVLFSVSHVGAYNYVPEWRFHDDGSIEPAIGATGRLQRISSSSTAPLRGWLLDDANKHGVSHLHNYFWRLDFDIGGTPEDDIVEEIDFVSRDGNLTREIAVSSFGTEAARSIAPERFRRWRVRDASLVNANGQPFSWQIELLDTGHRDTGPANEPFTFDDVYFTVNRACERYASHNPTAEACAENVADFVNGETLAGADLVAWVSTSFHHIPRDEDEPRMGAHWNAFRIAPRDVHDETPLAAPREPQNQPPVIGTPPDQRSVEGEAVALTLTAADADGDTLSFSASGLPPGLSLNAGTGEVGGTLASGSAGGYTVEVVVSDGESSDAATFAWAVSAPPQPSGELLDENFDTDTGPFAYVDDPFRGTGAPGYASGERSANEGHTGGALAIRLGGLDRDDIYGMSGGFRAPFDMQAAGDVRIELRYKLIQAPHYEQPEYSEMLVSVDGITLGALARITGNGNGGPDETTGWRSVTLNVRNLDAGTHTLTVGAYNNRKTYDNEVTRALVDDLRVTWAEPPEYLLEASFDTGAEGFAYRDDAFRDSAAPRYASGNFESGVGRDGGGLVLRLGGFDNDNIYGLSGAFERGFELARETSVSLTFDYRLTQTYQYERAEYAQALVALDGVLVGQPPNDYVDQTRGGNFTVDPTTGWRTVTLDLGTLGAGTHRLSLGAWNNRKTWFDEVTTLQLDNVTVTTR